MIGAMAKPMPEPDGPPGPDASQQGAGPSTPADAADTAIDFDADGISVLTRTERGWESLGTVRLAAQDFAEAIAALRAWAARPEHAASGLGHPTDSPDDAPLDSASDAASDAARDAPVPARLLLPPEQILARQYTLDPDVRGRAGTLISAARRLAEDTGHDPSALAIAVSPPGPDGRATVLAAPRETWEEARSYAERWGFEPRAVSTWAGAEAFGPDGPCLEPLPEDALARPARAAAPAGAARRPPAFGAPGRMVALGAGALILCGAVMAAFWPESGPPLSEPAIASADARPPDAPSTVAAHATASEMPGGRPDPVPLAEPPARQAPDAARAGPPTPEPVAATEAPPAPADRMADRRAPSDGARPSSALNDSPPGPLAGLAPPEPAAAPDVGLRRPDTPPLGSPDTGFSAAQPRHHGEPPAALTLPAPDATPRILRRRVADDAVSAALPAAPRPPTAPVAALAQGPREALDDLPDADAAGAAAGPPPPTPPIRQALPGTAEAHPDTSLPARAPSATSEDPDPTAAEEEDWPITALAPPDSPTPHRRPGTAASAGQDRLADAPVGTAGAAADAGAEAAASAREPGGAGGAGGPNRSPNASPAPPEDAPSALALVAAPTPPARPADLDILRPAPEPEPVLSRSAAPRGVHAAATQGGLALDRTTLVGVISRQTGRQALVRLPNGQIRLFAPGDELEGWRIALIGPDALSLERQGRKRVLLLVGLE